MRYLPFLLAFALSLYAFVDCLQTPSSAVRRLPKAAWLVAVWVPLAGAIGWLLAGRPARGARGQPTARPRPVAPDDDPDFLRRLRDSDAEHERMLRQWERDLRRREERHRDPGSASPPPAKDPSDDEGPTTPA